jgi:DNA-binding LytR/AlgR family response regulator
MNILIVENEMPASDRLVRVLENIDKSITIIGVVESVEATINWLENKQHPDLILMDIQLDDGLCFEIFETINVETPVIFTTAYDEYTLKAFKVNSVDYLLKPVEEESLRAAIHKYKKLYADNDPFKRDFRQLIREFSNQYKSRFLIRIGSKFKSVPVSEIGYFHVSERYVFLNDLQGKDYGIDYSLEQLEGILDSKKFFRINRNCIVNINMISMMNSYSSSRLQLTMKNAKAGNLFVVSRDKVSEFKKWADR